MVAINKNIGDSIGCESVNHEITPPLQVDALRNQASTCENNGVGRRMTAAREALGLSRKAFVSKIGGLTVRTLENNEAGRNDPKAATLEAYVKQGVDAKWLLTGQGEMLTSYPPAATATVLTAEESRAQYSVKRPEIDAVLLSGVIAAVDMANPQLGASERAAIAAKAYAEAISAAKPDQDSNFFSP